MTKTAEIKAAVERVEKVLTARPSDGQMTKFMVAEITNGVQCRITDGEFTIMADAPKTSGGDNTAPSPGGLARASLAACLAQGYAVVFALRDVPFDRLSVEVQSDLNVSSFFSIEGTTPGFQEIRHVVNVDSPADPAAIMAAIDENDSGSMILNSFKNPMASKRDVRINRQRDAAE